MSSFKEMIAVRLANQKLAAIEVTPTRKPQLVEEAVVRRPVEQYRSAHRKHVSVNERFSAIKRGFSPSNKGTRAEVERAANIRRVVVTLPDRSMALPHSLDAHYHDIIEKSSARLHRLTMGDEKEGEEGVDRGGVGELDDDALSGTLEDFLSDTEDSDQEADCG